MFPNSGPATHGARLGEPAKCRANHPGDWEGLHSGAEADRVRLPGSRNAPRALRLQSFAKTLSQQSIGERLDTFREQSEDGRGFDDSEERTGYCWSSCLSAERRL